MVRGFYTLLKERDVSVKCGDIIFVRYKGFIANAIRYFDKGRFTHVAIAVDSVHVLQSQYGMDVKIISFKSLVANSIEYEIISPKLNNEERQRIAEEGSKLIGKKYDIEQIIGYVLKDVFHLKNNILNNPNNLICSELVYAVLDKSGVLKDLGIKNGDIRGIDLTPNQLYDLVKYVS